MQAEFQSFDVEIVEFNETKIAVLEHKGDPSQLGRSIQKFISWRKENKLPPSKYKTFNLVYDDPRTTPADEFRFDLACSIHSQVNENDEGIINKIIPQGRCAVLRVVGLESRLAMAVEFLYSEWLEQSGETLRDFPLFFHRIHFFPDVTETEMMTDVYLPLK